MSEQETVVEKDSDEIAYFNVRNNSLRLVHAAGKTIRPGLVNRIVDDKLGINRKSIASEDYLEETEDESEEDLQEASADAQPKKAVKATGSKTKKATW